MTGEALFFMFDEVRTRVPFLAEVIGHASRNPLAGTETEASELFEPLDLP